jgi:hypothetical protein
MSFVSPIRSASAEGYRWWNPGRDSNPQPVRLEGIDQYCHGLRGLSRDGRDFVLRSLGELRARQVETLEMDAAGAFIGGDEIFAGVRVLGFIVDRQAAVGR